MGTPQYNRWNPLHFASPFIYSHLSAVRCIFRAESQLWRASHRVKLINNKLWSSSEKDFHRLPLPQIFVLACYQLRFSLVRPLICFLSCLPVFFFCSPLVKFDICYWTVHKIGARLIFARVFSAPRVASSPQLTAQSSRFCFVFLLWFIKHLFGLMN